MSNIKKLMMSAAGGAGLDVDEVFSTYLYKGTGSAQTITNGIDLAGEGGMVWIKSRSQSANHVIVDTAQGAYASLSPNLTSQKRGANTVTAFSSSGYTVTNDTNDAVFQNTTGVNGQDYASWTFRKAPKFFDCLKYVGNGTNQTISHNLGSVPGMIIVKDLDTGGNWRIYHRSLGNTYGMDFTTQAKDDDVYWNDTTPTDAVFTVGPKGDTNTNGTNYVAYLFAHNDGDGGFGPDGDQDIIKCGSWSSTGTTTINLGFEPQWILIKATSQFSNWGIYDVMRGQAVGGTAEELFANLNNAESSGTLFANVDPLPTGFSVKFGNTADHIYMAIRRGPLAQPESGTEVFEPSITYDETDDIFDSGFVTDMMLWRSLSTHEFRIGARLTQGKAMRFDNSQGELAYTPTFDYMNGANAPVNDSFRGWLWKRAPGYFDIACYTGTGSARTVSHNLTVTPEMMWVKRRDNTGMWKAYHSDIGNSKYIRMDGSFDGTGVPVTSSGTWNNTTPSDTTFTVGTASDVNGSGNTYIAYLFATLPGVSKVGSYTGNGSSQTINCGFTSGARFVLIKNISATNSNWFVFDTTRGIVSGNDNALYLNSTASQVTNEDCIDPNSSGFRVVNSNGYVDTNNSNQNYIFYAIA